MKSENEASAVLREDYYQKILDDFTAVDGAGSITVKAALAAGNRHIKSVFTVYCFERT